jgi:hypothetical protein
MVLRNPSGLLGKRISTNSHGLETRLAQFIPPKGRCILVCLQGDPSDWMQDFIVGFRDSNPRENIFLLDPEVAAEPVRDGGHIAYPLQFPKITRRFFRRLRAHLVLVDKGATPTRHFLYSAIANKVPVAFIEDGESRDSELTTLLLARGKLGSVSIYDALGDLHVTEAIAAISPEIACEKEEHVNLTKRLRFFFLETPHP